MDSGDCRQVPTVVPVIPMMNSSGTGTTVVSQLRHPSGPLQPSSTTFDTLAAQMSVPSIPLFHNITQNAVPGTQVQNRTVHYNFRLPDIKMYVSSQIPI